MSIELNEKLSDFSDNINTSASTGIENINSAHLENSETKELKEALQRLGYENFEIMRAIQAVTTESTPKSANEKTDLKALYANPDEILKASLIWLSREMS